MTLAYLRDASWYNHPDVTTPKKLHRDSPTDPGTPACNPGRVHLVTDSPVDVDTAAATSLCRRCFRSG